MKLPLKSEKFPKLSHSLINVTTKAEEKQLCFDKSFSTNQKDNENKTCEEWKKSFIFENLNCNKTV